MKDVNYLAYLVFLRVLVLIGCENRSNNAKITVFQGSLETLEGSESETFLLKSFPKILYKIYPFAGLRTKMWKWFLL